MRYVSQSHAMVIILAFWFPTLGSSTYTHGAARAAVYLIHLPYNKAGNFGVIVENVGSVHLHTHQCFLGLVNGSVGRMTRLIEFQNRWR
ncbi:hypothetical protein F4810DRAFT_657266 [Camillea tinctor]|nr:hypothetical protein F4810DRAFT_657266 [Camillea tinctor]